MELLLLLGGMSLFVMCANSTQINCNDGKFYIRADPESCSHFYKCDNGKPVRFTCPSTLYYNPELHVCDWPSNVKCTNNESSSYNNAVNSGSNQGNNGNNNAANNGHYPGTNGDDNVHNSGNNSGQNVNNPIRPVSNNAYNPSGQNNNPTNNDYHSADYDALLDDYMYPIPNGNNGYAGNTHNSEVGPSIQEPLGELERPRPTVDELYSGNKHPYRDYLTNNGIDIRK